MHSCLIDVLGGGGGGGGVVDLNLQYYCPIFNIKTTKCVLPDLLLFCIIRIHTAMLTLHLVEVLHYILFIERFHLLTYHITLFVIILVYCIIM